MQVSPMSPLRRLCIMTTRKGFYWCDYTWTHSWKNSTLDRFVPLWKFCLEEWMELMIKPWNGSSDKTTAVNSLRVLDHIRCSTIICKGASTCSCGHARYDEA